ncbi:Polyketide beta-ketoacyl-synthase [Mycena indigotica]|uniref:Polyketide beta-ketoacyl-synthase n=1 Tax=Mycena indigotica TaxID=2126181 RepID=A0A8H6SEI0_9AGAR|nr:Polyketide beta-ketoacyl-synthase [Mycena indigotica]KAF7297300.1 Polyketide beta-ketoacyl-synthase [Mycena indigotica]
MSSSSSQVPALMTSPVFRYAVLIVLSVVVILGACICYRTRVSQRRLRALTGTLPPRGLVSPLALGQKPVLYHAYIQEPPEKPREWDSLMPVSVTRASSTARISLMICMPFSTPFANQSLPDDERHPPHIEIGYMDVALRDNENEQHKGL